MKIFITPLITFSLLTSFYIIGMEEKRENFQPELDAACWHQNSRPHLKTSTEIIEKYIKVTDYRYIVDVGCYTGNVIAYMAAQNPQATLLGIDRCSKMIQVAQEHHHNPRINFMTHDPQELSQSSLAPYKANLITSFQYIQWIKDHKNFFEGIFKNLQPAGTMLITGTAQLTTAKGLLLSLLEVMKNKTWAPLLADVDFEKQYYPLEKDTVKETLKSIGFTNIEVGTQELEPYYFKNQQELENWYCAYFGAFPAIAKLSKENQKKFITDVANHYLPTVPVQKDGSIEHKRFPMVIKAQKPA